MQALREKGCGASKCLRQTARGDRVWAKVSGVDSRECHERASICGEGFLALELFTTAKRSLHTCLLANAVRHIDSDARANALHGS